MTTGKGGSSSQVTGYKYFMSVHFGIGRGPVNELAEIRVGDITAWTGSAIFSQFGTIDKPTLFGGDEKEGGIDGDFKLFMGESTQTIDSIITSNIEGGFPVPGWRGVTTLFYYGLISSNNPYPKPWKFRVNRTTEGWDGDVWHSELAMVPMQSSPLTLVSFNVQPHSGDSILIGAEEVDFFTTVVGVSHNVEIGSDVETTASRFAAVLNTHSADLYDVAASVNGLIVTLIFPATVSVRAGHGSFISVTQQGGNIKAMNPAHIIYECVTNNIWGRGYDPSVIDEVSFLAAATQLYAEGFGICLKWNRQDEIDRFIDTIVHHIGAALFIDRRTGLLTLNLIRDNYDADALPTFTFENGLLDIREDQSSSTDTSYNEIIVKFVDPVSGKTGSIRVQNLASFQSLGSLISTTVEYLGAPTAALAGRLAQRDLKINSSNIRRMTVIMDRVGWNISPGDVFKINAPTRGIDNMVLRAGDIQDSNLKEGSITIQALQDVFSLPDTSYVVPQPSYWIPPDRSARVIDQRLVDEMTYYDLAYNMPPSELAILTADTGLVKVMAEQPNGTTIEYILQSKTSLETGFADRVVAGFDASAELSAAIGIHTTAITFERGHALNLVEFTNIPVLIGEEYCILYAYDTVAGTATIGRGCIDTIPVAHPDGEKIWFQTNMPTGDIRDYSTGEIVDIRLISRTTSEQLDPSLAPIDTITIGGRQGRPYPPGNLDIDGVPFEVTQVVDGDIVFTWAHRNRITEANFLLDHEGGSTGPEAGTTYNVRVYDGADDPEVDAPIRTVTGISAATWTYTGAMDTADGALHSYWFQIESERDGLVSWQHYNVKIMRSSGFGDDFGFNFGGGPP